jgi:RNase P/RNase MRP subunit p29
VVNGSDPNECYGDHDSIVHFYEAVSASGRDIKINALEASHEGIVGRVVDRVMAKLSAGVQVSFRNTYVLHQEKSEWKIVQAHISLDVPN